MPDAVSSPSPVRPGLATDVFDHLATGLAQLAPDGTWRRANPALARLLGTAPGALVGSAAHRDALAPVAAQVDAALTALAGGGDGLHALPVTLDRGEDGTRCLQLSLTALPGGDALLQLHDATALRTMELLQDTLAFGISHELRAPVRTIEQFSRRLAAQGDGADTALVRDHVQRIRGAAAQAGGLIDALLETMRAARAPRSPGPVDISLLGDWICAELQDADPGRAAHIDVTPGLWAWGDEHALKQMLGKLLHNAWKFSAHRDQVQIELDGERVGDRLRLRLRDAGRGFDMRYADRLFVPFRRLHGADDGAGHGLGLAIAQRLAQAHGGRIRVESAEDVGTTFFIDLPAPPAEDASPP
ncbi:PAS domain-containing sensor histidine kinase [Luteimonas sp. FCS-9]|uniref:PAS domain-containing sensor histidine kinase n=1 Tax=Luteimonas sp. FCS-9 TaxID=1547516 RepID=UPI00069C956D|nr:PAS domain-containing sensor histidine kinase [Luteimonas sp. FCS-9]